MKKIFILLGFFSLMFSCTDLNENVYDKIPESYFPENETQAALRVIPSYQKLSELIDDWGCWFWAQEVTSDEIVFPTRLTDWDDGGKWRVLYQHTWTNNTDAVNNMWGRLFEGIFETNKAIDELLPYADQPNVKTTLSKIRTLRAFYYYLLIDNYGDVPLVTSFFKAPDKPVKEKRANIVAFLIKELSECTPYLPKKPFNFAVSKSLAYSILAKLYLNHEVYTGITKWKEAENYCDSIIDLGVYSLEANPLGPFKTENDRSPENIFTIPFDEDNLQGFRLHMRTLHYLSNQTFDMAVGPWNGFAATESHYNSYEENDLRKQGFLVGQQYTSSGVPLFDETAKANLVINPKIPAIVIDAKYNLEEVRMSGARVIKYEIKKGAKENLSNDFPLFRYADILLMKAEAMIRQSKNGDSYVNQIRQRAKVSALSGVNLDQLLAERGREMFCEGHRRQDLIRFGKFTNARWEKPSSSDDRKVFPIPQWAIDSNPNLQ